MMAPSYMNMVGADMKELLEKGGAHASLSDLNIKKLGQQKLLKKGGAHASLSKINIKKLGHQIVRAANQYQPDLQGQHTGGNQDNLLPSLTGGSEKY